MNRIDIGLRVRSITRDFSNSIFREQDVIDYINEGIERIQHLVPELEGMSVLGSGAQEVELLPKPYHHLLALYSASRCFAQDERHHQATNLMNEFETKMQELNVGIQMGRIVILDANGLPIKKVYEEDYVVDNYYNVSAVTDLDDGVEGVE